MNNREYTLTFCTECFSTKFDINKGIICSLINNIPSFKKNCPDYREDQEVIARNISVIDDLNGLNQKTNLEEETWGLNKFGVKNGIAAGAILILGSLIWFFGGWHLGIVYFYPPILFVIGLYILFKGVKRKNQHRASRRNSIDLID